MVYFYDKNHQYIRDDGIEYTSVSRLVDPYKEKFDDVFCSIRRAFRNYDESLYTKAKEKYHYNDPLIINELQGYVNDDLLKEILHNAFSLRIEWKEKGITSSDEGTEMHYYKERIDELNGYKINPLDGRKYKVIPRPRSDEYDNMDIMDEILKMKEDVCILEAMIVDHDSLIGGQEDVVFLKYMGAGHFIGTQMDYKTDEEINMKSFFSKGFKKMKYPLGYFMDCNFNHYAIKMSLYAVMLEKKKIKIVKNVLEHVQDIENSNYFYPMIYRSHAKKLIEIHKSRPVQS